MLVEGKLNSWFCKMKSRLNVSVWVEGIGGSDTAHVTTDISNVAMSWVSTSLPQRSAGRTLRASSSYTICYVSVLADVIVCWFLCSLVSFRRGLTGTTVRTSKFRWWVLCACM